MSEDFLRGTLVNAVPYAQRLPGLPEGMEMHDAAEIIRMRDARPLQIRPQAFVLRESAKEHRGGGRRIRRPHLAQQRCQITVQVTCDESSARVDEIVCAAQDQNPHVALILPVSLLVRRQVRQLCLQHHLGSRNRIALPVGEGDRLGFVQIGGSQAGH